MSEGNQDSLENIDARVTESIQRWGLKAHYDSHKDMERPQRMDNDVRTNLAKVISTVGLWEMKKIEPEVLEQLVTEGFIAVKKLYEGTEEAKLAFNSAQSAFDEILKKEDDVAKKTGKTTTLVNEMVIRHRDIFKPSEE